MGLNVDSTASWLNTPNRDPEGPGVLAGLGRGQRHHQGPLGLAPRQLTIVAEE